MKGFKKMFIILMACMFWGMAAISVGAEEDAIGTIERLGWVFPGDDNVFQANIDLTGDGRADQFEAYAGKNTESTGDSVGTLSMSVNGGNTTEFAIQEEGSVWFTYFALSEEIQLIRIEIIPADFTNDCFWVQYKESSDEFQIVLDNELGGFSYQIMEETIKDENTLEIKYGIQPLLSGPVNVDYIYKYSDGELKKESDIGTATSFYENIFTAMKELTFLKEPDGEESFTLKDGDKAALTGYYSDDSGNYLIFKYNKKEGYIKLEAGQKDSFYEISYVN